MVQQRLPSLLDHPIGFAHRGGRAHAPENTLEAFLLALRLGATGLETDVWLSVDGVPVISHDGSVRTGLRTRRIRDLTCAQLPRHLPTLADLLQHCGTDYHLSIDLKDPDAGRSVIDVVRESGTDLLTRVWLCHPRVQELLTLRGYDTDVRLVDSTRLERIKEGPERRLATLAEHGIDGINLFHTEWTGGLSTLAHRFGRTAFGWGIEHQRHFHAAYRMGLDGVYSDHVDRMMDAYREELGKPGL
ncbi:MAG: glycerophosphodiester phosphodiesterase [Actinobacteria bacterium]|nr:glycerophosphodiester phosphodiesterase [Actinomycetota bacterium]